MWTRLRRIALPSLMLTSLACSNASLATAPSPVTVAAGPTVAPPVTQSVPGLTGRWLTYGSITFRNLQTGNTLSWNGCSGSFTVIDQAGQRFTGRFDMQGAGFSTDRFCTASGTFTGDVAEPGGIVRARLDGNFENWPRPSVSPSCELISAGDGTWTGNATADAIQLQVRDTLRCSASVDGSAGGQPLADFERTVSLNFHPWSVEPR